MAVARAGVLDGEAIEFLGVVAKPADVGLLAGLLEHETHATSAVRGLGRCGWPAAAPLLLEVLKNEALAEDAATAFQRIAGLELPRGPLPAPPTGLTEDELDLWEPVPPVDAAAARAWWRGESPRFDQGKRYQAGLCVSDNPLGGVFDQLPMASRYDVYLRERALVTGVPDWELETWWQQQRVPAASGH